MNFQNIIIINNGLSGGGIERASTTLANSLDSRGYKVTIIALYKSDHFFTINENISFIEPSFSSDNIGKLVYLFKMIIYLRKNIKNINADTILSFGEWTNPFVFFANLGLNIPLYLSDRMSPELVMPYYNKILKKISYYNANGVIAQTEYAKEIIYKATKATNIKVIPNPVNIIEKLEIPKKNNIISVGRLSQEKGHKYLIEAFSKITRKDWSLSIIGTGPEEDNLVKLVTKLGITDRVVFHGHMKDFTKELSEASIFVLPSLQEGFPNALLEAMSIPLPCISTKYFSGNSEIVIDNVNGILIEPGNVLELTSAIENLINNPTLRNKLEINSYNVRDIYCLDKITELFVDFIFQDSK